MIEDLVDWPFVALDRGLFNAVLGGVALPSMQFALGGWTEIPGA